MSGRPSHVAAGTYQCRRKGLCAVGDLPPKRTDWQLLGPAGLGGLGEAKGQVLRRMWKRSSSVNARLPEGVSGEGRGACGPSHAGADGWTWQLELPKVCPWLCFVAGERTVVAFQEASWEKPEAAQGKRLGDVATRLPVTAPRAMGALGTSPVWEARFCSPVW